MARPLDSSRLAAASEPRVPDDLQLTSRRLEVLGLRIHARTGGEGRPVVLLHGYGVSGTYMLPLARLLAPSFSVFVPDLPGFGRSEQPPTPLGIADLASALADLLDAAGLQCPAFVANSMGCQVVTELAVRRPGRVGPIVLIGPTVDPQRRTARRQLLDGLRDAAREPGSLLARTACDDVRFGVAALLATARSALADRIEERLPLIKQPALVVRGERDGFVGADVGEDGRGPTAPRSARRRSASTARRALLPARPRRRHGRSAPRRGSRGSGKPAPVALPTSVRARSGDARAGNQGGPLCHSAAIRAGSNRSSSPQMSSVRAWIDASSTLRSRWDANSAPRMRLNGPARIASCAIVGNRPRTSYSVPSSRALRLSTLFPQGIPAGATSASRCTRCGCSAANSAAISPPSEWPMRSTLSSSAASSQRPSQPVSSAAGSRRPSRGRSSK